MNREPASKSLAKAVSPKTSAVTTPIHHAIFPVAGFGASFLPATKACPKEMLPIVDRPMIQYAVDEAAAAGITHMIFVTGRGKRAIEDHFDRAYELERELAARADDEALRELRSVAPAGVAFSYVRQRETAGVLDALLKARSLVGEHPFAVVMPDQLIDGNEPALAQLVALFAEQRVSIVGAERASAKSVDQLCFISADLRTSTLRNARLLVKVPPIGAASAPVNLAGRFIFTSAIWAAIESVQHVPEASLASAIRALMERDRVFARLIEGQRYDCGTKLGFLEAQFAYAQKRTELWSGLRRTLSELLTRHPATHEHPAAVLTTSTSSQIARSHSDV
jgi:UTP--glucose-1-phosphate uridylyltransferase